MLEQKSDTLEYPRTTYVPELEEASRKEQERRMVQESAVLWAWRKEELRRQKHHEQRELREMLARYSPWGKPGGGAPCASALRKKNVLLEPPEPPRNYSYSQGRTDKRTTTKFDVRDLDPLAATDMNKFYDEKSTREIAADQHPGSRLRQDPRNLYNEEVQVYKLTGGVELVPLLTSRRYHSQPQTTRYLATDATRPGYTIESLRALDIGNREYISELAEQIRRKREKTMEDKRREQESCRRHFDTWKRLWGRPGHGAPIEHVQRNNLYEILYRPVVH